MNPHLPPELLPLLAACLGWALLHSVWQGALIAAALAIVLPFLRSAAARHAACLVALLALVAAVATTGALVRARVVFSSTPPTMPMAADAREIIATPPAVPPTVASPSRPAVAVATSDDRPQWRERFEPMLPRVSTAWIIGVALLSLRHLLGWQRVRAIQRSGVPARPELQRTFVGLLEGFGCSLATPLLESAQVAVPMLAGLVKPAVLLPLRVITGLRECEIEAILAHELAHLARRDAWSNLAQLAVETLFFYHPAAWWIGHRARQERENAADDLALAVCTDRRTYASALAQLAEWNCASSTALAATGGSLLARIQRIVRPAAIESPVSGWTLCLPPLLAALTLTVIFRAEAEPTKPAATAEQGAAKSEALVGPGASRKIKRTPEQEANFNEAMRLEIAHLKAILHSPDSDAAEREAMAKRIAEIEASVPPTDPEASILPKKNTPQARNWTSQDDNNLRASIENTKAALVARIGNATNRWKLECVLRFRIEMLKARIADPRLDATERRIMEQLLVEAEPSVPPEDPKAKAMLAQNKQRARVRTAQDEALYSSAQRSEIASLYEVAKQNWRTPEPHESLQRLLEEFGRSNQAGWAVLYRGEKSFGRERIDYVTRAVEKFGDCFFSDGCQVGSYGRYLLAETLWRMGEEDQAQVRLDELKTQYEEATDHNGQPMSQLVEELEAKWAAEK